MGAASAIGAVQKRPDLFAAVALLGGGRNIQEGEGVKNVAFYVGCGSEDFALASARGLRDSLRKAMVRKVKVHEFEGMDHLVVVQLALREVLAFFEESARP